MYTGTPGLGGNLGGAISGPPSGGMYRKKRELKKAQKRPNSGAFQKTRRPGDRNDFGVGIPRAGAWNGGLPNAGPMTGTVGGSQPPFRTETFPHPGGNPAGAPSGSRIDPGVETVFGPPEGNTASNAEGPGNVTDIPTDVYGWSGLPKAQRDRLLGGIMPSLISSARAYPGTVRRGTQDIMGIYQGLPGTANNYMQNKMRQAKDTTQGAMQGVLNDLANRNVLSSQVAGDAMTNLGKQLNQANFGRMNDVALQTQLASQEGQARTKAGEVDMLANYPNVLGGLIGQARGSEQPWQPYKSFMSLIGQMV